MENMQKNKSGFTLVELMLVIAIIGILASVVMVSSQSSVDKSKNASAITTMSSFLPELVTCADDDGFATTAAITPDTTYICCTVANCVGNVAVSGHAATWKNINTKTGYSYGTPSGSISAGTYQFTATNGPKTITCKYADNECTST